MEAKKFIGKVLPDGHLSLPEDTATRIGTIFEVILLPINSTDIYSFAEKIAQEKGFKPLDEKSIENIIHESRGLKN